MAHKEQRDFFEKVKKKFPDFFKNKRVLDIGSLDVNGTHKDLFDNCSYIGLDVGKGPNVDVVSIAHEYDAPDNYFDTIISGSVFEHDMFYEKTIQNIIRMLKPGGLFLFTCAGPGYPEHGTKKSGTDFDAPLLKNISDEWANYYKNLDPDAVKEIPGFVENFPDGYFEIKSTEIAIPSDLYFYGIKGGIKYLTDDIKPEHEKSEFNEHIFVIDSWPDNKSKEDDLVNLIRRLKVYNIPILLSTHYAIKPEIQKMVDYYLYDKNNPILLNEDFDKYGVNSGRWTNIDNKTIINNYPYHHDYAIWETMRNAFNFCNYLGKKYIHFMEYDNLPDKFQYRQAFLERIKDFDAILYEYDEGSTKLANAPYSSAYIFSIKTGIALKAIDTIKTKSEYFSNKPDGWQLEKTLLNAIRKITARIHISEYIPNNNELNTQAVWARNGMDMNGAKFQVYLALDNSGQLYVHFISGFYQNPAEKDYLIEVRYDNNFSFYELKKGGILTEMIGEYKIGEWVKVYYEGVEVFKEFLGDNIKKFGNFNTIKSNKKLELKTSDFEQKEINFNFVNGAFIEIKEKTLHKYNVQFIDTKTNNVEYSLILESNHWAKASKEYYVDWLIKITCLDDDFQHEIKYNPEGRKVLISFDSKSLGDTLAWIPYIDEFSDKHNCHVVCSTFLNKLYEKEYPYIEFVEPGTIVHDIYASYSIGLYFEKDNPNNSNQYKNPTDSRKLPLGKIAADILGLEYVEKKPKLTLNKNIKKKKQVSIGIHSTAQAKYWNNPTGWQEVVDYLKSKNYKVILLSKEEDGFMGNKNPKGVIKHRNGPLKNVIKTIQESELFIGISGGLSWLSWAIGTPTILISGFTEEVSEPKKGVNRIINKDVCHGCWSTHRFDKGQWDWCPIHYGTDRQFECSKEITGDMVIKEIDKLLKIK